MVQVRDALPLAGIGRLEQLATSIRRSTGVQEVLFVVDNISGLPENSVVKTVDQLLSYATAHGEPSQQEEGESGNSDVGVPLVFAAMPFKAIYDDTYFVGMRSAANKVGAFCTRVDQEVFNDDILRQLERLIDQADVVVADLSEANPNVMYEVGYAHASGKQVIHITSTPLRDLPFDVRNWATLPYELGRTHALSRELVKRFKVALSQGLA